MKDILEIDNENSINSSSIYSLDDLEDGISASSTITCQDRVNHKTSDSTYSKIFKAVKDNKEELEIQIDKNKLYKNKLYKKI